MQIDTNAASEIKAYISSRKALDLFILEVNVDQDKPSKPVMSPTGQPIVGSGESPMSVKVRTHLKA